MTRHDDLAEYFKQKGVRTTANRILVLRALMTATQPMSLNELETTLYPMDKSSISRVLTLFLSSTPLRTGGVCATMSSAPAMVSVSVRMSTYTSTASDASTLTAWRCSRCLRYACPRDTVPTPSPSSSRASVPIAKTSGSKIGINV